MKTGVPATSPTKARFQVRTDLARVDGRFSDLQADPVRAFLMASASQLFESVRLVRRSFLFTAAGQFRIYAGFPYEAPVKQRTIGTRQRNTNSTYVKRRPRMQQN